MERRDADNIISFENYRKSKLGQAYKKDAFSSLFDKDLREQTELLQWYMFHQTFNKHKLFVHTLFEENHRQKQKNPNAGYVVCYHENQMDRQTEAIMEAVQWER